MLYSVCNYFHLFTFNLKVCFCSFNTRGFFNSIKSKVSEGNMCDFYTSEHLNQFFARS